MPRVWQGSEAVNVDRGQLVGRRLKDCPVVMCLHELAPVGGRAASGGRIRRLGIMRDTGGREQESLDPGKKILVSAATARGRSVSMPRG
jgi:hypothetical protein